MVAVCVSGYEESFLKGTDNLSSRVLATVVQGVTNENVLFLMAITQKDYTLWTDPTLANRKSSEKSVL